MLILFSKFSLNVSNHPRAPTLIFKRPSGVLSHPLNHPHWPKVPPPLPSVPHFPLLSPVFLISPSSPQCSLFHPPLPSVTQFTLQQSPLCFFNILIFQRCSLLSPIRAPCSASPIGGLKQRRQQRLRKITFLVYSLLFCAALLGFGFLKIKLREQQRIKCYFMKPNKH